MLATKYVVFLLSRKINSLLYFLAIVLAMSFKKNALPGSQIQNSRKFFFIKTNIIFDISSIEIKSL